MTVKRPGAADAAVVKLEGHDRALALTTDCTPRYCAADPEAGAAQAVAEAWRNLTAVGARPLAITDNMNFGNPEKPEIMGQFAAAIRGMAAACEALDFPVVSGNVSLYNETEGRGILPTPAIGGLGVLEDAAAAVGIALPPWLDIVVVGATKGWLGQSLWLREIAGREEGAPPAGRSGRRTRQRRLRPRPDPGRYGCAPATTCPTAASWSRWPRWRWPAASAPALSRHPRDIPGHAFWFGEDQARYLLAVPDSAALIRAAEAAGIPAMRIGTSGGKDLTLPDGGTISVGGVARRARTLPSALDGRPALAG